MNPTDCSVIVLYQSPAQPYTIDGTNNESTATSQCPSYIVSLQAVFGKVILQSNPAEALDRARECNQVSPTLLLIDLDALLGTESPEEEYDYDDNDSLYTLSCSSSCSTSSSGTMADPRMAWVKKISREMNTVPIVVCSTNDSPSFMLDCIHAGASDYLLKPLPLYTIKTLFLKLHRCRADSKMHDSVHGSSFPSSPVSCPDHFLSNSPPISTTYPPIGLNDRFKEIFNRDMQLTKAIMDIYVPLPQHAKYMTITSQHKDTLTKAIFSWDFCPFDYDSTDLIHCVYLIFEQILVSPELSYLGIGQAQLYDFIIDLSSAYHDGNPYHNFAHAVDVLQCLFHFLCQFGLLPYNTVDTGRSSYQLPQDILRPIDVFGLLLAAIGHDAAHPGVNNMFLINSATPLALLYNDHSILESLHSMTLFQLIKKHGLDQFSGDSGSLSYQEFRKTVITSILATDMSLHSDYVTKIKEQANRMKTLDLNSLDPEALQNERLLLCSGLIKCADISNVTRPFMRAAKWAELLVEEFVLQGDLERELGMPVLPMNDRTKVILEDSQIGFIRFVALDLFKSVQQVLPEMSFAVNHMESNLKRWEHRKNSNHNCASTDTPLDVQEGNEPVLEAPIGVQTTVEVTKKRTSGTMDGSTQVVEIHKRVSLDSGRDTSSTNLALFNKMPSMPAMAMESYGGNKMTSIDIKPEHPNEAKGEWGTHDSSSPAYCQCTIQ
ncbi:hypothetical protein CLU79DRAFT_770615 [Phycomyces nitens]|nr:hypothetical protein CLU79DRAFT_770615 [Phycomyces nitens]